MSSSSKNKKVRIDSRDISTPISNEPSTSHSLPKKVYEVRGKLVLLQELLEAGVVDIKGGDGKLAYCFFQMKDLVCDGEKLRPGDRVRCNAWLLDQDAKIPYLVSTVWPENYQPKNKPDRILGMPDFQDMQVYHKHTGDLAWSLPSDRKVKKESKRRHHSHSDRERSPHSHSERNRSLYSQSDRHYHKIRSWSPRREKFRQRVGSPDRRSRRSRSRSGDGRRRRSRSKEGRSRKNRTDIDLRDQGTSEIVSKNFDIKSVKPFAIGVASNRADVELNIEPPRQRRPQGRGRGRGRGSLRGGPITPQKKLAIGRNVFHDSDSQEDDKVDSKDDRNVRSSKEHLRVFESDDRPGLGFKPKPRENNRWKRWQGLSRKKLGEEDDDIEIIAKFPSPEASPEKEDMPEPTPSPGLSPVSSSSQQSQHAGVKVTVKTFVNEEVGILAGSSHVTVLFHVNQVWISQPSIGYCSFREIYPSSELSKHLYPGQSILCWARQISSTRDCNYQATVVWLEGEPPSESLYRTPDLISQLNFQQSEYQSGSLTKFDVVNTAPERLRSVVGVVQEWISHEVGVVRLEDGGVALFHIGQVWTLTSSWVPYTAVLTTPPNIDYLALGSRVSLAVRRLTASPCSELVCQALILWNTERCRAEEERLAASAVMFSRRGLEDGQIPQNFITKYSSLAARTELVRQLDLTWDNVKSLCQFDLKKIHPVPLVLNLVPADWEARVEKIVDHENGVICISHKDGLDMSGELKLGVTKMFAIFHIEDVYSVTGDSDGGQTIASVYHTAASQILLSQTAAVVCPVLQAVCVYIKSSHSAAPITLFSPRPTQLRKFPESFHREDPTTHFHLSYLLPVQLDVKAINFFGATNQAKLQREVNNGLAMAHFNATKRNLSGDRAEQQKYLDKMLELDHCHVRTLKYGSYQPINNIPFLTSSLSVVIPSVPVKVQLLYQRGLEIKEGLVRFDTTLSSGLRVSQYAFFDLSCYKFSLKSELRTKDLASVVTAQQTLKAHLLLADRNCPVSYVCTAVWNTSHWTRDPEPDHFHKYPPGSNIKVDPLFMEKYKRIVSDIVGNHVPDSSPTDSSAYSKSVLPPPIPASSHSPAVLAWATDELLVNRVGRVTSIVDCGNYGIAAIKMNSRGESHRKERAIVLFDTCDVWMGKLTVQQMDMNLNQVMSKGDYVKVKAILVPQSENRKNIRYLATSLVTDKLKRNVVVMKIPDMGPLENFDQIHPSKLNNFYTVVSAICRSVPGDGEDECNGVSTDEEQDTTPFIDTSKPPAIIGATLSPKTFAKSGSAAASISLDAYETEREKKKLAKANECVQQRRKLGYDKASRDKMVMELKLKNQLMWRCSECNISCGKAGMEKHVTSKLHWDNVLINFKKNIDSERPPVNC